MHSSWQRFSVDHIDDPELDLSTARVVDCRFVMDGALDWRQALNLNGMTLGDRRVTMRDVRRKFRGSARHLEAPVRLIIENARRFSIDDRARIGVTVPERFDLLRRTVLIVGLMECDVSVSVTKPTSPFFELGPLAMNVDGTRTPIERWQGDGEV